MTAHPDTGSWPENAHVPALDDQPRRGRDADPTPMGAIARRLLSRRPDLAREFEQARARAASGHSTPYPETTAAEVQATLDEAKEGARQASLDRILGAGWVNCAGLESLDADQHPGELAAWLADPDAKLLLLIGRVGAGKTHASYCTVVEAAQRGMAMRTRAGVVTRRAVPAAFSQVGYAASLRPEGAGEPAWMIKDRAAQADVLILDDLGAELDEDDARATQHVRTTLGELLNARYQRGGRTIVTTNLLPGEILETFDERVYSRLRNNATVLKYLGPDRREPQDPEDW